MSSIQEHSKAVGPLLGSREQQSLQPKTQNRIMNKLDSMVKKATISLADIRLTLVIHKYDDSPTPVAIAVADRALPSFESLR